MSIKKKFVMILFTLILIILFSFSVYLFLFLKKRRELIERNQRYLAIRQWRGVLDDTLIKKLKWKINSKIEFDKFHSELLGKLSLTKKYGVEISKKLEKSEWFLGMTNEQLLDIKGEPTEKVDEEVRKIVRTKFGNFADVKKKSTWSYLDGTRFIFINGKLENWQ